MIKKAAPDATDSAPDSAYTRAEQQHYEKIRSMEIHVSTLEDKWKSLKEDASDAKKAFEGAEAELRATIREGAGQMKLPGMEGEDGAAEASEVASEADPELEAEQKADAWESLAMGAIDVLTLSQAQQFAEAGIKTLGDFTKLSEKAGVDWYKQIKGIGKGKADEIDLLLMGFWADNPQYGDDDPEDLEDEENDDLGENDPPPEAEEEGVIGEGEEDPDYDPDYDEGDDDDDDDDLAEDDGEDDGLDDDDEEDNLFDEGDDDEGENDK